MPWSADGRGADGRAAGRLRQQVEAQLVHFTAGRTVEAAGGAGGACANC
ncbi:MAG: hypothetical protein IPK16_18675 [Anaerolineales bacterium]|nr:hypothetical protein [Anaerolineales bacterium]